MAITNERSYAPSEFRLGIARQTAWGTAITTQSNLLELHITEPSQIDYSGVTRDITKRSDGKIVESNTDIYVTKAGTIYSAPVSGILTDLCVDHLIYAVMQDIESEAATTPFLKIFDWNASTVSPDFGSLSALTDIGAVFTVHGHEPVSGESWYLQDAIMSDLTISYDPGSNGGRLSFSGTFISGIDPTLNPTSDASVWAGPGTDYYTMGNRTVFGLGGATDNLVVAGFTLNFVNGAVPIGIDTSGNAQGYNIAKPEITGEIIVKKDATTKDEIDTFLTDPSQGSAEKQITLKWVPTGSEELTFYINSVYEGFSNDFGQEAGVFINLPFRGVDDGTNDALTVYVGNAQDRGWT